MVRTFYREDFEDSDDSVSDDSDGSEVATTDAGYYYGSSQHRVEKAFERKRLKQVQQYHATQNSVPNYQNPTLPLGDFPHSYQTGTLQTNVYYPNTPDGSQQIPRVSYNQQQNRYVSYYPPQTTSQRNVSHYSQQPNQPVVVSNQTWSPGFYSSSRPLTSSSVAPSRSNGVSQSSQQPKNPADFLVATIVEPKPYQPQHKHQPIFEPLVPNYGDFRTVSVPKGAKFTINLPPTTHNNEQQVINSPVPSHDSSQGFGIQAI
jgi:hypothetical protein